MKDLIILIIFILISREMSIQRCILYSCTCIWLFLTTFSNYWVEAAEGYIIGNRRRIIAVLRIECILTALNILCHGQLMYWFENESGKDKSYERRFLQGRKKQCSIGLIIFLFAGQAVYFMYYAPEFLQWLLFDITSICAGVWTNLIPFVFGFWIMNMFTEKLLTFPLTAWVLDIVGRIPYFYDLIWNKKSQIKFAVTIALILSVPMYISSDWVVVKERSIGIKNFTATGQHLKVAMISDLHAGASVYKHQIHEVVDKVLENKVDAILIVGDMVDGSLEDLEDRVSPILQLTKHAPTYFVTGNHEYYYGDAQEWLAYYRNAGIKVLENDSEFLRGICIAGVNDISSTKAGIPNHKMNLHNALGKCSTNASRVLLAHNPASVVEFSKSAYDDLLTVDLVISGHTHAGQFYTVIPLVYWLLPYFYGLYQLLPNTQLMVTAGSLYQGPPMKMLGFSEVWILELKGV